MRRARLGARKDLLVLCYHAISASWPADLSVGPKELEAQISYLLRRGFRASTFADAVNRRQPGPVLAITFDDAFSSVFETARPILDSLGVTATVFVPTEFVDSSESMVWQGTDNWVADGYRGELNCMSSEQIEQLADSGWEIGAHPHSHPHLVELGDDEIANELRTSKAACERILGRPCRTVAYPYGNADARVEGAAAAAGFEAAAGLSRNASRCSRFYWARLGIYRNDSPLRFRLKCSRAIRQLRIAGARRGLPPMATERGAGKLG